MSIESNRSVDRVRKKRLPSYFAVATWTSNLYSSLSQCSGCVQSQNGVDLVVNIFYKSEKTSSHTVQSIEIKFPKVRRPHPLPIPIFFNSSTFFILLWPPSLQAFFL